MRAHAHSTSASASRDTHALDSALLTGGIGVTGWSRMPTTRVGREADTLVPALLKCPEPGTVSPPSISMPEPDAPFEEYPSGALMLPAGWAPAPIAEKVEVGWDSPG